MNTYRVFFQGLVCHIADESLKGNPHRKIRAAIINAPNHVAQLKFHPGSVDPSDEVVALQPGDDIVFGAELQAGQAETTPLFDRSVPSLRQITDGGDLAQAIKNGEPHSDVVSYLWYPEGQLTVAKFFDWRGIYVLSNGNSVGPAMCIASLVEFSASTNEPKLTVKIENGGSVRRTIVADATSHVHLMNMDPAEKPGHLEYHRRLTNAPSICRLFESKIACGGTTTQGADPECTNSGWP